MDDTNGEDSNYYMVVMEIAKMNQTVTMEYLTLMKSMDVMLRVTENKDLEKRRQ